MLSLKKNYKWNTEVNNIRKPFNEMISIKMLG